MECFSICTGKGDKRIVRSHRATFKGEAKPAKKEVKKKTESSSSPAEKSKFFILKPQRSQSEHEGQSI